MMRIAPSILAADMTDLKRVLQAMDPAVVDFIHMNVMDGHFVPTLSFGEVYTKSVKQCTNIPLDVHLMVDRPEAEVPKYYDLHPHNITFHMEATHFPVRLARDIREKGIKCGVALNPGTSSDRLETVIDEVDLILLMSVEPGFYGQKFIESSYEKIRKTRSLIGSRDITLEVDGGVNAQNIGRLCTAGVTLAVAGAAAFNGSSVDENVKALKEAARTGSIGRQ